MTSMYDQVLLLPIFQGISYEQLTALLEKIHFRFVKFADGDTITEVGEECTEVKFLISGSVKVINTTSNGRVRLSQTFTAPFTLPFYCLFGTDTHHHMKVVANGQAGLMTLDKQDLLSVLQTNPIMLINVMNILSSHAQKQHKAIDLFACLTGRLRMAEWLLAVTQRAAKEIVLEGSPSDFSQVVQMDMAEFWKNVEYFEKNNIIEVGKDNFKLVDRYALIAFVREKNG